MISGQAQGKQAFDAMPTGSKNLRDDELPLNSDSSVGNASRREYHPDLYDKGLGGEHQENCDYTPQSPSETLQSDQMYEECAENVGSIANRLNENVVVNASKIRCLWFEEAPTGSSGEGDSYLSLPDKFYCSEPPASTVESEMLESSLVELRTNFSKSQMAATLPPRSSGKSPLTVSKPSGIGLHLNSIVNAASMGRGAASIKLADSYLGVQVMKSASITVRRYSISGAVECRNEFETSAAASSATTQSPHSGEFVYHENRKYDIHSADSYEECNPSSPKTKRKRSSRSIDNDGCKRCNCSKTKCLKLYCDCFAAGLYCDQSCCCKDCFNKPEYEDTVLETRQKIESRNPLAFAPKVLEHVDENQFTPASVRHKRGCSCKKSLCLKRYCECYQSNVGCSNGCRCEGCQNTYGTRAEFVDMDTGVAEETTNGAVVEVRDSTFDEKLQMVAKRKDSNDSLNLTLMTPALQRSLDTNNISNSRVLQTRCTPSPQSDLTIISRYETSKSPQINSENSDNLLDTSKELLDMGSYVWRADYENIEIPESSSPRCDAAPTTCHLTPLSGPESMTVASASSATMDLTKASQVQLRPRSQCLMSCNSLHWHSSPVNAMPLLDGVKSFQGLDSEKGLCEVTQDDTPEILKDTSMPIKSVKVSSPNKKRVSPPHSHNHELGASSSGGLRSGRKFILKAVGSKDSSTIQNMSSLLQDKDRKR